MALSIWRMVSWVRSFCGPFGVLPPQILQLHQSILPLPIGVHLAVELRGSPVRCSCRGTCERPDGLLVPVQRHVGAAQAVVGQRVLRD